jgi:hypothetical protein
MVDADFALLGFSKELRGFCDLSIHQIVLLFNHACESVKSQLETHTGGQEDKS